MRVKNIIIDVLDYLEQYVDECDRKDVPISTTDFLGYINSKHQSVAIKRNQISGGKEEYLTEEFSSNKTATDVSILVSLLFRYAKNYIKKALKDSPIKTADEFSFLIMLLTYDSMTKQELITSQVMEKTSGIEIINRMIKKEFILQYDDENDGRSKRIRISDTGRIELVKILPQMNRVSQIVVGNLTTQEQSMLSFLMRKLDHFHNDIFLNEKEMDFDKILEKAKKE